MKNINIMIVIFGLLIFIVGLIAKIYSLAFAVLFLSAGFIISGDNPFGKSQGIPVSKGRKITGEIFKWLGIVVLVVILIIRMFY